MGPSWDLLGTFAEKHKVERDLLGTFSRLSLYKTQNKEGASGPFQNLLGLFHVKHSNVKEGLLENCLKTKLYEELLETSSKQKSQNLGKLSLLNAKQHGTFSGASLRNAMFKWILSGPYLKRGFPFETHCENVKRQ